MTTFIPNNSFPDEWAKSGDARRLALEYAESGLRHARQIAPVRTGEYRASLKAQAVLTSDGWVGVLSSDASYAPYLEFGTSSTPTFATLRRSLESTGARR